jgi:hypothetical protein
MSRIMLAGSIAIFLTLTDPGLAASNDPSTPPCTTAYVQSLVCEMLTFNPDPASGSYSPPNCPSTSSYNSVVKTAYENAPWKVKQELCNLKNIVIQTDPAAVSWGYWENPNTKPNGGTRFNSYIGIRSDKTTSTLTKVLNDNFTATFENTTPSLDGKHTVTSDTASLGLLAVLAHEIGHLKWHRDNIYVSLGCYYDKFAGANNSWKADQLLVQSVGRLWHPGFNNPNAAGAPGSRATHANPQAPDPHTPNVTPADVRKLYTMGFVSAIAGISPEEDFVETYALLTALNIRVDTPPTISLKINNGLSVTIPDASSNDKRQCIDHALINFPPWP